MSIMTKQIPNDNCFLPCSPRLKMPGMKSKLKTKHDQDSKLCLGVILDGAHNLNLYIEDSHLLIYH